MEFLPQSTIYLCNVPIDITQKNQLKFPNPNTQYNYFKTTVKHTFNDYLTVRRTKPDGTLVSSVKVDASIESLYDSNYMFYQNYETQKVYYCFIKEFVYINEGTTEVIFETDVYQTWIFYANILPSFVEREHSKTDAIGDNKVPESFKAEDFVYYTITGSMLSGSILGYKDNEPILANDEWGYLVGTSETYKTEHARGYVHSGIYQGIYFYYFTDPSLMNTFLDLIEKQEGNTDVVLFISCIPKFCISKAEIESIDTENKTLQGLVKKTEKPAESAYTVNFASTAFSFDGYTPKNNKLWTAPFSNILITNHAGNEAVYNREDFSEPNLITFKMYGDISASPTITAVPLSYKGQTEHYDFGISQTGFPQCAYHSDVFKLWLAKNAFNMGVSMFNSIGQAVGGGALLATGNYLAGAGLMASGVNTYFNAVNSVIQASKEPDKVNMHNTKNNLVTAMGKNKLEMQLRLIKGDYARTIDDYFTMFGYQTNEVKVPNMDSRPYYNYVKTIGINITGRIPSDDLAKLKQIFDTGVTLWKYNSGFEHFGKYNDEKYVNSPTK